LRERVQVEVVRELLVEVRHDCSPFKNDIA
jgi:hypothetical protein